MCNFGVAVAFEIDVHLPPTRTMLGGQILYPLEAAQELYDVTLPDFEQLMGKVRGVLPAGGVREGLAKLGHSTAAAPGLRH